MRLLILSISVASSMMASAAFAEECDRNDQTQTGMNICAGSDFAASDAKLNAAYGDIMKRLSESADARKLLQDSQRSWIVFRDAECKFASSGVEGGSIYPMIQAGCLQGLTDARVTQLGAYLKCEEGDLSCPVPAQ
ncbi:lysozyme inhibitor LprI family protein [Aminobacter niigataensis]|uniref:lysozyme inhibitor LprI family protein n=1 Tax=Aminobacter niigataensis TaxID=83265 RepID=UPI0024CC5A7A|nr:lysozyme inhibitor LprI family protein [Aminobacter niigataensis]CAI2932747.1 LprI domain-containing protein [Aminobacter niigataensis]